MRRQIQLRRRTPLRRTPIRRARSRRPSVPTRVRVDVATRSGGRCELVWTIEPEHITVRCPLPATDMHHRLMRSQGGAHTADNLLHLCADHHRHVHAHPAEAYEHGWLIRRNADA